MEAGDLAVPALRTGLSHPSNAVRVGCCIVLDHYLDESCIPALMENLDHPYPTVRTWALHALACERCKEGECRPGEDDVVPIAIRMLRTDPDRYVRKQAVELIGPAVHRRREVADALAQARDNDPDPLVRKVAAWWAPGGPRYERTLAKERVRSRTSASEPG